MLKAEWDLLTVEERVARTMDTVEELKQLRGSKRTGTHNISLGVFHDIRATIQRIEREVRLRLPCGLTICSPDLLQLVALNLRIGADVLLCVLRGEISQWSTPHTFTTSNVFDDYFQMCFEEEIGMWVRRLECYKLGKVEGASSILVSPQVC